VQAQGNGEIDLAAAFSAATPPNAPQPFTPSAGGGSLDSARGSDVLQLADGASLTGDVDVFGAPVDTVALAAAEDADSVWNGGLWLGQPLLGDPLQPNAPLGSGFTGHAWDGHAWDGHAWDGHAWDGHAWDGHAWDGHAWDGHAWDASSWLDAVWR
jgi:hypothetical protein